MANQRSFSKAWLSRFAVNTGPISAAARLVKPARSVPSGSGAY